MKPFSRHILLLAALLSLGTVLVAQEGAAPPGVYFPAPRDAWETDVAIGVRMLTVPRDIAEEELNKAPAVDVQVVTGLPWQFSANGRMVLQYFTNHFRAGARWSHRFGRFTLAVGDDAAFWFGFFDFEGFDNRANGWINYPNLALGWDFGDVRMTAKGEAIFLMSQHSLAGTNEVSETKNTIAGGALSLVLEQPLWRDAHALLGVRLALTKFHYQTWFAFSTFDRHLLFSELLFGLLL